MNVPAEMPPLTKPADWKAILADRAATYLGGLPFNNLMQLMLFATLIWMVYFIREERANIDAKNAAEVQAIAARFTESLTEQRASNERTATNFTAALERNNDALNRNTQLIEMFLRRGGAMP